MWWLRDPGRLKVEIAAIDGLREREPWLASVSYRPAADLVFSVTFDLVMGTERFEMELRYPHLYPESPPSVLPRDGRRLSGHQYGRGGELCLEYRSDNWDPSITGAMMIESAYRLISGERAIGLAPAEVLSAHQTTLGQELRGSLCRFLMTKELGAVLAQLPVGTAYPATTAEIYAPKSFTAFIQSIDSDAGTRFQESQIPITGKAGTPATVVIANSPQALSTAMDEAGLRALLADVSPNGTLYEPRANDGGYFVLVAAGNRVKLYFSFAKEESRVVIPYDTIDLTGDHDSRLAGDMTVLPTRKVGIVGCGSLGSKVAVSLARTGVGGFVLVDDDVLKPSNLVRNELDAGQLGAHKVDGLEARLKGVSPHVTVSVRRVVLGGQEASGSVASVLDELGTCDLVVDLTADPNAFNFTASVARGFLLPMIWAEVYAGGIGGFVVRLRPGIEPPPHAVRAQYFAWCREQGVEAPMAAGRYDINDENPLVASDADVAVIAAHTTRMAIDVLVRGPDSHFLYPAYVIGLVKAWIFTEPFDTRPIRLIPAGDWKQPPSPEVTKEAVELVLSLLGSASDVG